MSTCKMARGGWLVVAPPDLVTQRRLLVLALDLALSLRWRRRFRFLGRRDLRPAHGDGEDRGDADVLVDGAAGREVTAEMGRVVLVALIDQRAVDGGRAV